MDALLMCGGRGSRLALPVEKPLLEIGGRPMVSRVREALAGSRVETIYAVSSPNASETRIHLDGIPIVETPGDGYVADLQHALDVVEPPVLTVAADLPLLTPEAVDQALDFHDGDSMTVCVPASLKRDLGVSVGTTVEHGGRELAPTGLNVVADSEEETMHVTEAVELAVNVNRVRDAQIAEVLL